MEEGFVLFQELVRIILYIIVQQAKGKELFCIQSCLVFYLKRNCLVKTIQYRPNRTLHCPHKHYLSSCLVLSADNHHLVITLSSQPDIMCYWMIIWCPHKGQGQRIKHSPTDYSWRGLLLSNTSVRKGLIAALVNQSEIVKLAKHAHGRILPEARSELKRRKTTT